MTREEEIRARLRSWENGEFVTWNAAPFTIDIHYLLKDNEFKSTLLTDAEAQVDYLLKENQRLRGVLKDACSDVHGWFGGTQEGYDITEKIIQALEGETK